MANSASQSGENISMASFRWVLVTMLKVQFHSWWCFHQHRIYKIISEHVNSLT